MPILCIILNLQNSVWLPFFPCFDASLSLYPAHLYPYIFLSPSLSGCIVFFVVQSMSNWDGIAIYWEDSFVFCVSRASTYSCSCLSNIIPPLHKAVLFGIPFWLTRFFLAPHNKERFEFVYSIYQLIHQTQIGLALIFGKDLLFSHQSQSYSLHVTFMHITFAIFLRPPFVCLIVGFSCFLFDESHITEAKQEDTHCFYMKFFKPVVKMYIFYDCNIFFLFLFKTKC